MKKVVFGSTILLFLILLIPNSAFSAPKAAVLKLDLNRVPAEVGDLFVSLLMDELAAGRGYQILSEGTESSVSDMALMLGCLDIDTECLSFVADSLEADKVIIGSIDANDRLYLVQLKEFDKATSAFVNDVSFSVNGTEETFTAEMDLLVKRFVYGDFGTLVITTSQEGVVLSVDDEPVEGPSPIKLEKLIFGTHTVKGKKEGFQNFQQEVVIKINEEVQLTVELLPGESKEPELTDPKPSSGRLWTWVSLGTGVAAVAGAVVFSVMANNTENDLNDETGKGVFDPTKAESLQDSGKNQALIANILYGAGGVFVALGVVLFFVEGGDSEVKTEEQTSGFNFDVEVNGNYAGFKFNWSF